MAAAVDRISPGHPFSNGSVQTIGTTKHSADKKLIAGFLELRQWRKFSSHHEVFVVSSLKWIQMNIFGKQIHDG